MFLFRFLLVHCVWVCQFSFGIHYICFVLCSCPLDPSWDLRFRVTNLVFFCLSRLDSWFLTESWNNSCSFFVESCFLFLVSLSLVLESFSCFLLLSWSLVHKKKKKKRQYLRTKRENLCKKKKGNTCEDLWREKPNHVWNTSVEWNTWGSEIVRSIFSA